MIDDISDVPNLSIRLVDAVCAALEDTPLGIPGECGLYHTTPPDDCCDFAAVWIDRIVPTSSFPIEKQAATQPGDCATTHPFLRFGIRWMRKCWPAIERDESGFSPFPPKTVTDPMATKLQMDGIAVWCRLFADLSSRNGTILGPDGCDGFVLGPAVPRNPRGECVGWTIFLDLDVGLPCCI